MRECLVELVFRPLDDGVQQGDRDILADDRRCLEESLVIGREPIDACGQHGLHRGGRLDTLEWARETVCPPCPFDELCLYGCPHTLLEEERIALGPLDQ